MTNHANTICPARDRRGLTLVEMLVVIALTVLIMSIVVQVLVLASGTVSQLRATSAIHQNVRAIESVIRADLESRSIRDVAPAMTREVRNDYLPGADGQPGVSGVDDDANGTVDDLPERGWPGSDDVRVEYEFFAPLGIDPAHGLGFFMIEENSPADEQGEDGDDVLQLTLRYQGTQVPLSGGLAPAYYGRAVPFSEPDAAFPPTGDGIAGSLEAEVTYFLRNGTLYRRVLLVGVPQPSASYISATRSWYEQYDISVRPALLAAGVPMVNTMSDLTYRSARFGLCAPRNYYGSDDIAFNTDDLGLAADRPGDVFFPYGPIPPIAGITQPNLSFNEVLANARWATIVNGYHDAIDHHNVIADQPEGDNRTSGGGTRYPVVTGAQPPVGELWWGRPTLREMSALAWDYPTAFDPTSGVWSLNVRNVLTNAPAPNQPWGLRQFDPSNAVPPLAIRAAEDVLLTGVRSFDIKVWDPDGGGATLGSIGAGAYVDLGYGLEDLLTGAGTGPFGTSGPPPGPYPSAGSIGGTGDFDDFLAPAPQRYPVAPAPLTYPDVRDLSDFLTGSLNSMSDILDNTWPPERGRTWRGFATPWRGHPGFAPYSIGMAAAPSMLWRTYDTWCSAYTKPDLRISSASVAPPYVVPLRGIQIKIRFTEPETGQTREMTLVQELH